MVQRLKRSLLRRQSCKRPIGVFDLIEDSTSQFNGQAESDATEERLHFGRGADINLFGVL
jgi:hypothetical protein